MRLSQSVITGDMGEDGRFNTLCIEKDTLHQMTPGLITRTYMHQNCLRNITNPPQLDKLIYKRPLIFPAFHMTLVLTICTPIDMSQPSTPTITLASTTDSPQYAPLSPTLELEDTFVTWTPQLAIRSAGLILSPTNNQQLLIEIWGLVISRITAAQNIFSTTMQHACHLFIVELKARAHDLMHFHELLPELPANEVREKILIVCEPSPITSEVPPLYSDGSTSPPLLTLTMPSPSPIPIPP